ncbi:MAG: hypothetical protein ACOC1P_01940 [Minisyncoccales bacterium]
MKKQIKILILIAIFLVSLFLITKPFLTGKTIIQNEEKIKLGYCPTMEEDAMILAGEENYELIKFNSASETLLSLKEEKINKALIGRKAKQSELNSKINEKILESGYTLTTNKKSFIEYSQLQDLEIYTYLSKEITENLIPSSSKIIYSSKEEAVDKVLKGEAVLVSWKDWQDNFELVVIMDENQKVKKFRGIFLYENEKK